jgi:repressor LexA
MLDSSPGPSLTARQSEILAFIESQPYPPTVREIGEFFGITSPNGVSCHLKALERKGVILRKAHKARDIIRQRDVNPPPTWCSIPFGGMIR